MARTMLFLAVIGIVSLGMAGCGGETAGSSLGYTTDCGNNEWVKPSGSCS